MAQRKWKFVVFGSSSMPTKTIRLIGVRCGIQMGTMLGIVNS